MKLALMAYVTFVVSRYSQPGLKRYPRRVSVWSARGARRGMPGVNRHGRGWRAGLFVLIAAFVVAIDQATKLWIRSHLPLGESLQEVGFVRLIHVQNTGSAFGLFANQAFLLTLVAIVGLVLILLFYRYLSELPATPEQGLAMPV